MIKKEYIYDKEKAQYQLEWQKIAPDRINGIVCDTKPIAKIELTRLGAQVSASGVVDEDYRQKGIGTIMLKSAIKLVFFDKAFGQDVNKFVLDIDADNFASRRSAQNAGFVDCEMSGYNVATYTIGRQEYLENNKELQK